MQQHKDLKTLLTELAVCFRNTPRLGNDRDEPEGTRYIYMSDTAANKLADVLDAVAERVKE